MKNTISDNIEKEKKIQNIKVWTKQVYISYMEFTPSNKNVFFDACGRKNAMFTFPVVFIYLMSTNLHIKCITFIEYSTCLISSAVI